MPHPMVQRMRLRQRPISATAVSHANAAAETVMAVNAVSATTARKQLWMLLAARRQANSPSSLTCYQMSLQASKYGR